MLPASRSGTSRISASPATGDTMLLSLAASRLMALSNASGPSSRPPVIWPRSAILHSAAASIVDGISEVTVSTADRIATFGRPMPQGMRKIDRVLHDIDFILQRRKDVHRSVGDEQRFWIGRHVHDEDVADAPRRAQPVSLLTTASINSSVCRLPFISASASPAADHFDAFAADAWLYGVSTSCQVAISGPRPRPGRGYEPAVPTNIGLMIFASAASMAPRREVSSQGCTTAVRTGASAWHA